VWFNNYNTSVFNFQRVAGKIKRLKYIELFMNKAVSIRQEIGNSSHNMFWFTVDIREKYLNLRFFPRLNCNVFLCISPKW